MIFLQRFLKRALPGGATLGAALILDGFLAAQGHALTPAGTVFPIAALVLFTVAVGFWVHREILADSMGEAIELLELAQAHAGELTLITDPKGTIVYASPSVAKVSGYEASGLIGANTRIFKSGKNSPELYQELWQTIASGQVFERIMVNTKRDNGIYYEMKRISPVLDGQGRTRFFVSCGMDVTAQIKAEERYTMSEERFASAMRSGHDCIMDWRLNSPDVYFSPSWKAMLGYREDDLPNTLDTLLALMHPEDHTDFLNMAFDYGARRPVPPETEFRLRHFSGRWRLIQVRILRMRQVKNPVVPPERLVAVCTDVTDRSKAEQEMRLLSRALRHVSNGVLIADAQHPDLPIIFVNEAFTHLTGYSLEDARGRNCRYLQGTDTQPDELQRIRDALKTGTPCDVTLINYRKNGQPFWNHLRISPVRDERGRLTHFIGVQEDVSRIKQYEQELLAAKETAEKSDQIKSEFLSTMSHELRTPLNGVLGMVELLMDTPLDDEQRDYAEEVSRSGQALLAIVNTILDYVKLINGDMQTYLDDISPRELMTSIVQVLRPGANDKGLALTFMVQADVPETIRSDIFRLRQLVTELVTNAIKFTERGKVTISVRTYGQTALILEVTDSGPGIPLIEQETVFKPFMQLDGSIQRSQGGIGMGLTLAKAIAVNLGGRLTLESELGHGTTVRLTLPLATPAQDSEVVHTDADAALTLPS